MQQDNSDKIWRDKLANHEVKPPDFMWNRIERQLPPVKSSWSKYKYLLLALLFIGSSVGSVLVYENYLRHNIIFKNKLSNNTANSTTIKANNNTAVQPNLVSNTNSAAIVTKNNEANNNSAIIDESVKTINTNPTTNTNSTNTNNNTKKIEINRINKKQTQQEVSYPNSSLILNKNKSNANTTTGYLTNATKKKNKQNIKLNNKKTNQQNTETAATINNDISTENISNDMLSEEFQKELFLTEAIVALDTKQIPLEFGKVSTSEILTSFYSNSEGLTSEQVGLTELDKQKEKQLKNLKEFSGVDITKGFHAGVLMNINNNWLTNKNSSKEDPANSIKHKLAFSKGFGVNLGYDYTTRWGIQTEIAYTEVNQSYQENNGVEILQKDLNLTYLKVPLTVKHKINFINNYNSKPVILNFLFGPQFNMLLNKKTLINEKVEHFEVDYNKSEIGLLGGVDFDLFLTKNFYMTFGTRLGFTSNFSKNATKNFQVGVTTQFNFKKPSKIK